MRTLLFVSCLLFLCGHSGLSQDSSRLDLGRIELSASALQGVTIRGEWLERLPFTRLSEVVDVYFEGTRSNPANTVYVIDGNQVTSPDLYPIQDIEAITYVQNALIVVNGAHQFGPMVVVRTRNGKRQGNGLRAYGQSALLNRKIRDPFGGHSLKTNNVYYHRYGLSGHTQAGRWSANGTAEYLREAQPAPVIAGLEASKPARFHRVRLNAAAGTGWANGGRLQFEVQYLPQAFNYESVTNITSPPLRISRDQHSDESLLHGAASLHLPLTARLQNRLSVHYNRYRLNQEDQDITQDPMNNYQSDKERRGRYSSFLARNTLTYTVTAGELSLQPALGLWFQSARLKLNEEGSFQSSGNINEARSEYLVRPEQFMATPSFTL
ncbi:MAG TPA: hypothetical protein VHK69_20045, partial [Chitinophagaceae bacterium]|nr:hypothetical protein [Chitinophagaceae bacterium]